MKNSIKIGSILLLTVFISCQEKVESRFNYGLVKSKIENLTKEQAALFDEITTDYTIKVKSTYEAFRGNKKEGRPKILALYQEQDQKIKNILSSDQYQVYTEEIKIEREGREKYNTTLIRDELGLDSVQTAQYNLANEAFYKLLIDNHDNYHGKPEVYLQYYAEIDISRRKAFKELMTADQYIRYEQLADEHRLGKVEAY